MKIVNRLTKKIIARNARYVNSFLTKVLDIFKRDEPEKDEAIIVAPCHSINAFFVKNPIDVVFVDEDNTVCYVRENLQPWQFTRHIKKARFAIEMAAGKIKEKCIFEGSRIQIFEE